MHHTTKLFLQSLILSIVVSCINPTKELLASKKIREEFRETHIELISENNEVVKLIISETEFIKEASFIDNEYAIHIGLINETNCMISAAYTIEDKWFQDYKFDLISFVRSGISESIIKDVEIIDGETVMFTLKHQDYKGENRDYRKTYILYKEGLYDPEIKQLRTSRGPKNSERIAKSDRPEYNGE